MKNAKGEIFQSAEGDLQTTKFVCKICGQGLDDDELLKAHIAESHHPKRTITANDIINLVFEGELNYPKTKREIIEKAEKIKSSKPEVTPEIMDVLRNLPHKQYNDEAELAHAIQTTKI
jgi:hypothetical protein